VFSLFCQALYNAVDLNYFTQQYLAFDFRGGFLDGQLGFAIAP
jgi:hypothetical protein